VLQFLRDMVAIFAQSARAWGKSGDQTDLHSSPVDSAIVQQIDSMCFQNKMLQAVSITGGQISIVRGIRRLGSAGVLQPEVQRPHLLLQALFGS